MVFNRQVLFSSAKQDWKTPKEIYETLDKEFAFDCDPCPHTPIVDGLTTSWGRSNFVNPPYKDVAKWIQKGFEEFMHSKTVVFLVPSRTDAKWFDKYVLPYATEIRFIKGRLKFSGHKNSAPFPSAIIIYKVNM